jgi:CRISPR-associated protein Csx10
MRGAEMTEPRCLVIELSPKDRAVFSRQNANEGDQKTFSAPPGSALWGWAISQLYNGLSKQDAFTLFHSGKVRFSDAVPMICDAPAFPRPSNLVAPKHLGQPFDVGGKLQPQNISVGRAQFKICHDKPDEDVQGEAIAPCHITFALDAAVKATRDHRLRTAMEGGVAKQGSLFGYESLAPTPTIYRATIEADDLSADLWKKLTNAFTGALFLGKARNSGFGGEFECAAIVDAKSLWPAHEPANGIIKIWCLSDIALSNKWGVPMFDPPASAFGLTGTLCPGESSATTRRFAPWDRKEDGYSSEIMVIEAGSVLAYTGAVVAASKIASPIGAYQERGFGRFAIMLHDMAQEAKPIVSGGDKRPSDPADELRKWATRVAENRDTKKRDDWITDVKAEIEVSQSRAIAKGPSRSQWAIVGRANRTVDGKDALLVALGKNAGDRKPLDQEKAWGKAEPDCVRQWLFAKIADADMPALHLRFAVDQLVKMAKEKAPRSNGSSE